ncbi:MAG: GPW/gp25 family protein [Elainellaceae cyanobacterium]
MEIYYPFRIDGRGRTAEATTEDHIRQMIEQVLFTRIGERVNRPDFGGGLQQLIFGPNSPEMAAATQLLVQSALEQWLGEVIQVEAVVVEAIDARLEVTVQYLLRRNQDRRVDTFARDL